MPRKSSFSSWMRKMNATTRKMSAASRRMAAANRRLANQRLAQEKREARERAAREKREARERAAREKMNRGNYCANCGAVPSRDARFCPKCGGKVQMRSAPNRTVPSDVKMYVWQRDGGRCVECGSKERLEYDHIIPVSKGGSNTERNVQLLCEHCNRTKHDKIM
jgi:5-methylcytosine-specific restriction endonuclease McrA